MFGPAGGDVGRTALLGTSEVGRFGLGRVGASGALAQLASDIARVHGLYVF